MTNIYEIFDCKSKAELYTKLKQNQPEVKPLADFLEYGKLVVRQKKIALDKPELVADAFLSGDLPEGTRIKVIFVDAKLRPVHKLDVDLENQKSMLDSLKEGVRAGAYSYFIAVPKNMTPGYEHSFYLDKFKDMASDVIKMTDQMHVDEERKDAVSFYSELGGWVFMPKTKDLDLVADQEATYKLENQVEDFSKTANFEDFTEYYASQENLGLDVTKDRELIKQNLKVGFQDSKQEVFGFMFYDKNNQIIDTKIMFKGAMDQTLIDMKVLLNEILKREPKGVIAFHNHPSGNPEPSAADHSSTRAIEKKLKMFGYELADHCVIGKEGVYSFRENGYLKNIVKKASKDKNITADEEKNAYKQDLKEAEVYDPLAKDMDNDGIPDRYDHDFRDSGAFQSTYDVDGLDKEILYGSGQGKNETAKEVMNPKPKKSVLAKIKKLKEEIKKEDIGKDIAKTKNMGLDVSR